ncbi:flap endonuclease-1 [Candidatus Woesearchaeota archaeon]|nr:flap endonuclease-1 [Candidatus Woesearchaeota archaeon]
MGVNLKDLVVSKQIELQSLQGKVLAVDTYNMLYQFLSNIRQVDGTPLKDSKGRVTSHLVGLFNRVSNFLQHGLKLIFVFDGKPPEEKWKTQALRMHLKKEALKKFEEAKAAGDLEAMRKYASRTSMLTKELISDAERLIKAFGCPVVKAPSEGEAQAAFIAFQGHAFASASQDFDGLLFKAPRIVRNLAVTGKRKLPNKPIYVEVKPELILYDQTLQRLGINHDQLIVLAMLVGTDFNVGGIPGIGPKKALALVKKHSVEEVFKIVEWDKHFETPWREIFDLIKNMPVTKDYELEWNPINEDEIIQFLVHERDFSLERVKNNLARLRQASELLKQKSLEDFFK